MKNSSKIISIDPGKSGAIVVHNGITDKLWIYKMLITPKDVFTTLRLHSMGSCCFIEKVQGMPKMSGSGMFTFGKGYGWLEMALLVLKIPTEAIRPQDWMKAMRLGTKGKMTDTEWKNKLKARAQQLNPDVKVTLWNADALLLNEYGRRFLSDLI